MLREVSFPAACESFYKAAIRRLAELRHPDVALNMPCVERRLPTPCGQSAVMAVSLKRYVQRVYIKIVNLTQIRLGSRVCERHENGDRAALGDV